MIIIIWIFENDGRVIEDPIIEVRSYSQTMDVIYTRRDKMNGR